MEAIFRSQFFASKGLETYKPIKLKAKASNCSYQGNNQQSESLFTSPSELTSVTSCLLSERIPQRDSLCKTLCPQIS